VQRTRALTGHADSRTRILRKSGESGDGTEDSSACRMLLSLELGFTLQLLDRACEFACEFANLLDMICHQ
jgi:hypothetical protein